MSEILGDERQILIPFDKRECISLNEAAGIAGKSASTMRGWCDEFGLGRRIGGGTWSVSKVALAMHLDGDKKALRAYHAGSRDDPRVVRYFEREGLRFLVAPFAIAIQRAATNDPDGVPNSHHRRTRGPKRQ
jgi:hypothetical protein